MDLLLRLLWIQKLVQHLKILFCLQSMIFLVLSYNLNGGQFSVFLIFGVLHDFIWFFNCIFSQLF